jgi:hypothetical protein
VDYPAFGAEVHLVRSDGPATGGVGVEGDAMGLAQVGGGVADEGHGIGVGSRFVADGVEATVGTEPGPGRRGFDGSGRRAVVAGVGREPRPVDDVIWADERRERRAGTGAGTRSDPPDTPVRDGVLGVPERRGRRERNAAFWALAVGGLRYLTGIGGLLALAVCVWQR